MTPIALAASLFPAYEEYRLDHLRPSCCTHGTVVPELRTLAGQSNGLLALEQLGQSLEGRSINLVTCGRGERKVLLWSQMHGDESTATMALLDIFNFLNKRKDEPWVRELLGNVTMYVIPMLNPDGAERIQRYTAANIDMNRDALMLATPEARILKECQRKFSPAFGFNLHDQSLSSVGATGAVTALSLLAPALDVRKSMPPVRTRAMRVGALVTRILGQFVEGHIATYDDAFEARAFGDNMQLWGTSTLLIESGHWPKDPEKLFIRKLNYVALLTSLWAIGNGSYQDVELDHYANLIPNGKRIYDIIIRDVTLRHPGGWSHPVDLALLFQPASPQAGMQASTLRTSQVAVKEIGDLQGFGALEFIDGHSRSVLSSSLSVEMVLPLSNLLDMLQL